MVKNNVFKRLFPHRLKKLSLCGKGLRKAFRTILKNFLNLTEIILIDPVSLQKNRSWVIWLAFPHSHELLMEHFKYMTDCMVCNTAFNMISDKLRQPACLTIISWTTILPVFHTISFPSPLATFPHHYR